MAEKPIILGIETSCDETAVSLIQDDDSGIPKILSNFKFLNGFNATPSLLPTSIM